MNLEEEVLALLDRYEREPAVQEAPKELRELILDRYPAATFSISHNVEPYLGVYLNVTVDVEDTDEVFSVISQRLTDMQVEDGLSISVAVDWPEERLRAYLAQQRAASNQRHATAVAD